MAVAPAAGRQKVARAQVASPLSAAGETVLSDLIGATGSREARVGDHLALTAIGPLAPREIVRRATTATVAQETVLGRTLLAAEPTAATPTRNDCGLERALPLAATATLAIAKSPKTATRSTFDRFALVTTIPKFPRTSKTATLIGSLATNSKPLQKTMPKAWHSTS